MLTRRKARPSDLDFLLTLRAQTMVPHLQHAGLDISDEAMRARALHALENAEILHWNGCAMGLMKVDRSTLNWELIQFQIAPSYQGRGLGHALLQSLLAEADDACADIELDVLKQNPARRLYEQLGFTVTGENEHEYHMRYLSQSTAVRRYA